jgi:outer membrane protein assembly complex protein YaeT
MKRLSFHCRFALGALLISSVASGVTAAEPDNKSKPESKPAQLRVSGYGLLDNLRLRRMLSILQEGEKKPEFFNAAFIDDATFLLAARLRDDGYLKPVITAEMVLDNGKNVSRRWDESVDEPLPRTLRARKVRFRIEAGVLYYFESLTFSGLNSVPEKKARRYFVETVGLISLKQNRVYSPDQFRRSMANLEGELRRLGFQDATVEAQDFHQDDKTGRVSVVVKVREGPKFIVRSVRQQIFIDQATEVSEMVTNHPGMPYSQIWEQDFARSVKTNYFRQGYPDTAIDFKTVAKEPLSGRIFMDIEAVVKTGPRIRTGEIHFRGNLRTDESVLERRVKLEEGDWLDRIKAEDGRNRLSRLGIFDSVELSYQQTNDNTRNVNYDLKEGKRVDVSLLVGYGSYDLLRGGVQVDQYNVFDRAHHQQIKLVQSFKSSSADYTYTMPEFFGEDIDVFFNGSGLRRDEPSFTRLEYGGGAGARKFFRSTSTDVSLRYNYSILEAQNAAVTNLETEGLQNSGVGAIIADINHDRRDNPLYPHSGYKIFSNIEIASQYLLSEVNYQRVDIATSWHVPLSDAQFLHLGLSHGFVSTAGSASKDLPFNRRFFPGGENSVRGYQEEGASPKNAAGEIEGAETYVLGNLEIEQSLTPHWSLVAFLDAVGFAKDLKNYPGDTSLFSVGGGLRWKTFIGPVRLEYGYNLNPRPHDPTGTLHFSLGFPF